MRVLLVRKNTRAVSWSGPAIHEAVYAFWVRRPVQVLAASIVGRAGPKILNLDGPGRVELANVKIIRGYRPGRAAAHQTK